MPAPVPPSKKPAKKPSSTPKTTGGKAPVPTPATKGKLQRICLHWSAGGPTASTLEKAHYHFLVEASSKVVKGLLPPESNIPLNGASLQGQANGSYMAHCGGGNSFTIGVSLCGMQGKGANGAWVHPLNAAQVQAACKLVAQLCQRYGIALSEATVYTHYEFGLANPTTASAGKIDISVLPFAPQLRPAQVGHYLRQCIAGFLR